MSEGKSAATPQPEPKGTIDSIREAWLRKKMDFKRERVILSFRDAEWIDTCMSIAASNGLDGLGSVAAPKAGEPPQETGSQLLSKFLDVECLEPLAPHYHTVILAAMAEFARRSGAGETPAERPELTKFRCDCGLNLLVEGQVIGKEFLPPGAGSTKEGK